MPLTGDNIPTLGTKYSQPGNKTFPPWESKTCSEQNGLSLPEKRPFTPRETAFHSKRNGLLLIKIVHSVKKTCNERFLLVFVSLFIGWNEEKS